jgi:NTE family protein
MGRGLMDAEQLKESLRMNIGEYSFLEAFEKSGRSINITVSPVHHHQKPRLLSHYTSPYLLVWSATQASCSVPGIFPPTELYKKDKDDELVPYMPRLRWVDGSVVSDLPVERLMHLYDVNFSIVSQTNPHIVPFLKTGRDAGKSSLLSLPARILKAEVGFHGKALFDVLRKKTEPELLRQLSGQLYTILAQKYYGDVTIAPDYSLSDYTKLLVNPSTEFVRGLTLAGERATWPKIAMIRTHAKISQTLERCIHRLENKKATAQPLRVASSNSSVSG